MNIATRSNRKLGVIKRRHRNKETLHTHITTLQSQRSTRTQKSRLLLLYVSQN